MEYALALEYYEAISVLEGQEMLLNMKLADYPRASNESRKKFHRDVSKVAFPKELQKEMDFDDFFKVMGNG